MLKLKLGTTGRGALPYQTSRGRAHHQGLHFQKNSRTRSKILVKIPKKVSLKPQDFPEQVTFILKALLVVKNSDFVH